MKKLIALSIALSFLASLAFAETELTIKGRGEVAVTPLQIIVTEDQPDGKGGTYTDTYVGAGIGRIESDSGARLRLDMSANFENRFGFRGQVDFNKKASGAVSSITVPDFLGVWAKPIDWIKVDVGRFNVDNLRGKIGYDNWMFYTVRTRDADAIFTRFKGQDLGAQISLTPIEGLFIGVLVPRFTDTTFLPTTRIDTTGTTNSAATNSGRAYRVYERIQIGVGYEIQGIGLVRAQFVGANTELLWDTSDPNNHYVYGFTAPRIEAAFAFTGVENLVIDFGFKVWLPLEEYVSDTWVAEDKEYQKIDGYGTYFNGLQFALGAEYTMGAIGIAGRVDLQSVAVSYKPKEGKESNPGLVVNVLLWPSYDLGFATLGLDIGLQANGKAKYDGSEVDNTDGLLFGAGLWAKKTFGGSHIKGGLAFQFPSEDYLGKGKKVPFVFSVPITFEYNF